MFSLTEKNPHRYFANGTSRSRGVAISSNSILADTQRRVLFVKGILANQNLAIASIYAPNDFQLVFLDKTLEDLHKFTEGELLIGGDLNLVVDKIQDKTHKSKNPSKLISSGTGLSNLFSKYDMVGIWRNEHLNEKDYTYFSPLHNIYTRIDYLLASTNLSRKKQQIRNWTKILVRPCLGF